MSEETAIALIAGEDPEFGDLTPRAVAFLQAYRVTLTLKGAATATEMSRRNHYNGLHRMPGYREAFEKVDQEVDDSFLAILVDRTVNGFTEARFSCSSVLCSPSSRAVVSFPHSDTGGDTIRS